MDVRFSGFGGGKTAYTDSMKKLRQTVKAKTGASAPSKSEERLRDTVKLSFRHVLTAEKEGYIEVNGEKIAVSADMTAEMRKSYEWAAAKNEARQLRELMKQNAETAKQQAEAAESQSKTLMQALEIMRRISKGGRVPPQDEKFLMDYSEEMYMMAKMQAILAKKHEKYDTVLEDEEESEDGTAEETEGAVVQSVEATVSGGEVTDVSVASTPVEG